MSSADTIAAIATPPGKGGIGVVRVSGPGVKTIIPELLGKALKPRTAHYTPFHDAQSQPIDNGIAIFFPGPASYTGEDTLELYAHGSRIVLEAILDRVIVLGARLARPGEFTQRAFLNDKIDLVQAEAVADLVNAVSSQAARSAIRSLAGEFSMAVEALQKEIITIRTMLESGLDFPDEDIEAFNTETLKQRIKACLDSLNTVFSRAKAGCVLGEGITMVITGRPNTGKSTLLNRLAGNEVAIVTDVPGTTRDLIECDILIEGVPVHITDTAGIRLTDNQVEMEGIRRAKAAAARADVIIILVEDGEPTTVEENGLIEDADENIHRIILHNKIDLSGSSPGIDKQDDTHIWLSMKTGAGYDLLISHLKQFMGVQELPEDSYMARRRHLDALSRSKEILQKALAAHEGHQAAELLAEDLREAHRALEEITGEFSSDDLLGKIFSEFCIGK